MYGKIKALLLQYTTKNTAISQDFVVWKFCEKALFPHSFRRVARNYAETVPFRKISMPGNQVKLRHFSPWSSKEITLIGAIGKVIQIDKNIQKSKNRKKPNRFWIRPGKTGERWQGFLRKAVIKEWRESFRMSYDTFMKLLYCSHDIR